LMMLTEKALGFATSVRFWVAMTSWDSLLPIFS
jgi:hypothetical protein